MQTTPTPCAPSPAPYGWRPRAVGTGGALGVFGRGCGAGTPPVTPPLFRAADPPHFPAGVQGLMGTPPIITCPPPPPPVVMSLVTSALCDAIIHRGGVPNPTPASAPPHNDTKHPWGVQSLLGCTKWEGGGRNNPKFWGPPAMDALWDPSGRPIGLGGAVSWGGVYA